jgi:hypothetical protein
MLLEINESKKTQKQQSNEINEHWLWWIKNKTIGGCTWIKSWWGTEMPTYTDQKISNRISKILNELKKGIVCNDASQRMRCQICFLISQRTRQKKATKTDLFFDMTLKINLTCRSLALFLHLLCCTRLTFLNHKMSTNTRAYFLLWT